MFESNAMLAYLCESRKVEGHWYARDDPLKRAKVNEYLHWHHLNLRHGAEGFMVQRFFNPFFGVKVQKELLEEHFKVLSKSIAMIEKNWINTGEYLIGSQITIADLTAVCEIA